MKEIPEIAKAGILIHSVDPQPEVRKNAEAARDWVYSKEAANLYRMAVVFKNRFLDPILLTDRRRLPDPVKPGRPYHNREFVLKCESLGLHPMLGAGCHTRLADGPFALLMKELSIQPPDMSQQPTDLDLDWFKWLLDHLGKSRKGTSTLRKWTCPECGLNARFGIKGNPEIIHEPCSQKKGEKVFFVQADGLTHTIFESNDGATNNQG